MCAKIDILCEKVDFHKFKMAAKTQLNNLLRLLRGVST